MIPLTLPPKRGFTFNSQEEHQEMRAISEMSGFAIEASPLRAESPWQQAEGVLSTCGAETTTEEERWFWALGCSHHHSCATCVA